VGFGLGYSELSVAGCIFYLGQELSVKPLACLVPTAPTAHGGSKEDLLAMNDTARRAGLNMRSIKDCVCYAKSKEEIC
jgi:hypothetical protein